MNERRLLRLGLITLLTTGCAATQVQPSIDSDTPTATSTATMVPILPTATVDVSRDLAHLPPARETAIVSTAEAYNSQVLIEQGFPEVAIRSNRNLKSVMDLDVSINGEGWTYPDLGSALGSTIIKSDQPGLSDFIFVTTAGHGFDPKNIGLQVAEAIDQQFGAASVNYLKTDLKSIQIGENLVLQKGQFGMTYYYDAVGRIDYAFIAIPKANIPPNILDELMRDAVPGNQIMFDKITPNEKVVGVCKPIDTGFKPVPAVDARYAGNAAYTDTNGLEVTTHGILVKPWLVGGGCSGAGPFVIGKDGVASLLGINSAYYPTNPGLETTTLIYPFSDMGEVRFWNIMKIAIRGNSLPN